jgi:hypothetical protein
MMPSQVPSFLDVFMKDLVDHGTLMDLPLFPDLPLLFLPQTLVIFWMFLIGNYLPCYCLSPGIKTKSP